MNRDQFSGKWHEFKGKVREKWGKLTDDDVSQIHGKWEQLCGKLQQKYGWTKEQAEKEMNRWCSSCDKREENRDGNEEFGRSKGLFGNSEEKGNPGKSQESWNQRGEEKKHPEKDQNRDKKRKAG